MVKKSNVGKNKVIRKVDKLQEVKFHGKDTGPESSSTWLHHNTRGSKMVSPSVRARNAETLETKEFPVKKGSLRKFNANLRKAESRAVSFVEGRSS